MSSCCISVSFQKAASNSVLRAANTYKTILAAHLKKPLSEVMITLRKMGVDWMRRHGDMPVWDGMTFKVLAMSMSGVPKGTYGMHCATLETDKEWIDASLMHALGCVFRVDVALWQEGADVTMVGHSLARLANGVVSSEALDMIPIALVNDLHYWGVIPIPAEHCGDLSAQRGDDVRLPQVVDKIRKGSQKMDGDSGSDGDGALVDVLPATSIIFQRNTMSDADVTKELNFCKVLMHWSPWEPPTDDLETAMAALAGKSDSARCMLRAQVIEDLAFEAAAGDDLPDAVKYNRGARYRLQLNRPLMHDGASRRELLDSQEVFLRKEVISKLDNNCGLGKLEPHTCLDQFLADPGVVRNWRVMWHSLPASHRREALLAMAAHEHARYEQAGSQGAFKMKYKVLGIAVCKNAFAVITGIGSSSLTEARGGDERPQIESSRC